MLFLLATVSPASAKTAMQSYVEAMQPGWNLGNTLDATPNETAWGNPLVTKEYIQQVKAQGFNSIRIPVTWDTGGRVGAAPTYTIDPAWMNRVQQVVDWSLDAGLYVMLNMHHDSGWVSTMPTNHDAVLAKFNAIWSQIAPRFRDHSNKLMFESINEPTFNGVDAATKMSLLNELNTSFFHIVRSSGGGNATRPLVLPSVETNAGQPILDSLKATITALNDPNVIVTNHYYGFWPFAVNIAGVTTVNDAVINDINNAMNNAYNTFVADGIPVVIGEIGLLSYAPWNQDVERGEVLKYFEMFTAAARAKGITWQIWDGGQMFDRSTYQWHDQEIFDYFKQGVTTRSSTAQSDLVFLQAGTPVQDAVINLNLNGNTFVSLNNGATPLNLGSDYTISGSVLTIKASALAPYASGAYGEKAVLAANFNAGIPWKLHVHYTAAPVISPAPGSKSAAAGLVIPFSFNGDLLATMEAKYVAAPHYPYPGPASWTAYKGFGDAYVPDYANNTVTIKKAFFDEATNDPIELSFHMWSGRTVNYRLTLQPGGDIVANPQVWSIYSDGLSGWNNWGSWASNNPDQTAVVHSGTKAISVDAGGWGALVLGHNPWEPAVDTSAFKTLVFWINGGSAGGQNLGVGVGWGIPWIGIPAPQANTWTKVEILLSDIGAGGKADISNFMIQNWTGGNAPTFYIDDIQLTTAYPSTIVFVNGGAAPVVTSATSASGTFNARFSYSVAAINSPTSFSAANLPPGLTIDPSTGIISGAPSAAGSYLTTVTATNASGDGSQTVAITIAPATATVALSNLTFVYDGTAKAPTVTTVPSGVAVSLTYNSDPTITTAINAGSYKVVAAIADPNYTGANATGTLTIAKATPTISVASYTITYDGTAHAATGSATGAQGESLAGLNLSGTTHTNAGSYTDTWTFTDVTGNYLNATGTVTDTIAKALAKISLAPLTQLYDGTAKSVTATTAPANLTVVITYDGGTAAPIYPGAHTVTATVNNANYTGTQNVTLTIYATALVRHAPTLNGEIYGSLQFLTGESFAVNGDGMVSGDLLAPGTPSVQLKGHPTFGGVIDATGATLPTNYNVTLHGEAVVRHVVRRVDPIAIPVVTAPTTPVGTRDVTLTEDNQTVGSYSTLRNLTIDEDVRAVAIPAGVYGRIVVNGETSITLGVAGATEPAVYELQELKLNGHGSVKVVGPVKLKVASGVTLTGTAGASDHPEWLDLAIADGGFTLDGDANAYAIVTAPNGTVAINGRLHGRVTADRLTINGDGVLENPAP